MFLLFWEFGLPILSSSFLKVKFFLYTMLLVFFAFLQCLNEHHSQMSMLTVSSSSSCRTISMDIPDPLPPTFSMVHRFRQIFKATSCIGTEQLYVCSGWLPCLCSSIYPYEFVPTSPAVYCMSGSSNLDCFRDV